MAKLCSGPFFIPNFTHGTSTSPINLVCLTFINQTTRTQTVRAEIDQVIFSINSPAPISPLLPATVFTVPPKTVSGVAVPLFVTTNTTGNTNSSDPRVLIVTIDGDIIKSGELVQVWVTGGYSSDGLSLDIAEQTMFFKHGYFEVVHEGYHHNNHHHPLT